MDTTSTLPTPEDDTRTLREIAVAVAVAVVAGLLVFLSIVGVISLITGDRTLNAVNKDTKATEHIAQEDHRLNTEAAKFYRSVGAAVANFEHNQYVTCLAVHATGCLPPPP